MARRDSRDDEHTDLEQSIRSAWEAKDLDTAATLAIEGYASEILSFLSSRLGSWSSGQEVFSMFAEDLWTGLGRFGWRCSMRTWAYALARNAANRYSSSPHNRVSRNLALSQPELLSVIVERARSATQTHRRTEIKDRFRILRERLDLDDQMLLILRIDRDMTWRDIAIAMGGDMQLEGDALARESARLRKSFERIKTELKRMAKEAGLLGASS
jgi:RNA polymerase sigma-70 factor (ECF subfamily)